MTKRVSEFSGYAGSTGYEEVRDVHVEDLVFIDESGVNLGLIRLFAWALQGRRVYGEQPKRGKNVSVVDSSVVLGAFDGLSFQAFGRCPTCGQGTA